MACNSLTPPVTILSLNASPRRRFTVLSHPRAPTRGYRARRIHDRRRDLKGYDELVPGVEYGTLETIIAEGLDMQYLLRLRRLTLERVV